LKYKLIFQTFGLKNCVDLRRKDKLCYKNRGHYLTKGNVYAVNMPKKNAKNQSNPSFKKAQTVLVFKRKSI
jgi:hypothetical protein